MLLPPPTSSPGPCKATEITWHVECQEYWLAATVIILTQKGHRARRKESESRCKQLLCSNQEHIDTFVQTLIYHTRTHIWLGSVRRCWNVIYGGLWQRWRLIGKNNHVFIKNSALEYWTREWMMAWMNRQRQRQVPPTRKPKMERRSGAKAPRNRSAGQKSSCFQPASFANVKNFASEYLRMYMCVCVCCCTTCK